MSTFSRSAAGERRVGLAPWMKGLATVLLLLALPAGSAAAAEVEDLAPRHREWLEDVRWLIPKAERKAFLKLEKDHQRDAFIRRFWQARDPYPDTARNEFRDAWYARLEYAEETYGNTSEDRARLLIYQGAPDVGFEYECPVRLWPLEIWRYDEPEGMPGPVYTIFFQNRGAGPMRLWQGQRDGLAILFSEMPGRLVETCRADRVSGPGQSGPTGLDVSLLCAIHNIRRYCPTDDAGLTDTLIAALSRSSISDSFADYSITLSRLEQRPRPREEEWLDTFHSYSTDLPEDAVTFEVTPTLDFPRREGGRTVVRLRLAVPRDAVQAVEVAGRRSFDFSLTGEVLRDGELFESFRYRFDAPEGSAGDTIPLIFQRLLRPGDFRLVLKLEDLHGGGFWRREIELPVPEVTAESRAAAAASPAADGGLADWLGGAGESAKARVELSGPEGGPVTGMTRFDVQVVGEEVARIAFYLDGRRVMTKVRPPYSLELDLGPVPRPHTVRAVALDSRDRRLGLDELDLNAGEHRFAVRLVSPASGDEASGATEVQVELSVPQGKKLERLELWVGEQPAATLYQEPFLHTVDVPAGPGYVRAVAYLDDGASREAVSFVNATDPVDEIRVELVEVYASVLRDGRPVGGLERDDFRVLEDGVEQEVLRFERVTDRPIHVVLMVDSSASMAERIDAVREAAGGFLERTLTERDRAAVVPFADRTVREVELTDDFDDLTLDLATLEAERGTALYDNLISVLYNLNGVQGQRAVLLLSDGKDGSSSFTFAEARQFARAAGVAIYTIAVDLPLGQLAVRREFSLLSGESGGRGFFVEEVNELDRVYAAIEAELRSKYLLVYQSSGGADDGFRQVEVQVEGRGLEVKAMRGYYP